MLCLVSTRILVEVRGFSLSDVEKLRCGFEDALSNIEWHFGGESYRYLIDSVVYSGEITWSSLARCVRVTPAQLRDLYRFGIDVPEDVMRKVVSLVAFSKVLYIVDARLKELGFGLWLENIFEKGTMCNGIDLYSLGRAIDLLVAAFQVVGGRDAKIFGVESSEPPFFGLKDGYDYHYGENECFSVEWGDDGQPSIFAENDIDPRQVEFKKSMFEEW